VASKYLAWAFIPVCQKATKHFMLEQRHYLAELQAYLAGILARATRSLKQNAIHNMIARFSQNKSSRVIE
jgi:hypothetical protein